MKVTYKQHCGDDLTVVNAARVSFDKESGWVEPFEDCDISLLRLSERDTKLINYLARENHKSPFNHTFITLHVKAPVFVARQLQKHEYMPINEVSRRYVTTESEFYVPEVWRKKADNVKQGSSDVRMEIDNVFRNINGATKNSRRSPCSVKFANWKARAKRKGTEFSIAIEDVPWETHCPIMGMELNYALCDGSGIQPQSPTLDRIDSSKGYIKGNIQVLSWLANTMKSCATQEELMTFIKGVALRHGGGRVETVSDYNQRCVTLYKAILEEGGCAEQARMVLPQSMYTEWFWSGTLFAWAKMYNLRIASDTQRETQEIARQAGEIIEPLFPVSWTALTT